MQNDMLNRAECIGQAISRIHKREGPFVMFEYVRDADFQFWLQRTFKSLTLCLVSFVAFFILVQSIPNMQFWLYAFFRWILIPVKPLLVMEQSGAVSAGLLFLSNICFM